MGGDGGTLNNSRAEHASIRRSLRAGTHLRARAAARASVRDCALTGEPLRIAETVVCRAGQLYNREALVAHLLRRARARSDGANSDGGGVPHVRRLARDVIKVRALTCALTRTDVRADSTFSVGWKCGCVCAPVDATGKRVLPADATRCAACDVPGPRVALGMTAAERDVVIKAIVAKRAGDAKRKKDKAKGQARRRRRVAQRRRLRATQRKRAMGS
eukprot:IDg10563t1